MRPALDIPVLDSRADAAPFLRALPAAIVGTDLQRRMVFWNGGAETLFGFTGPEALGQPVALLVPAARLAEDAALGVRARAGESFGVETRRRHKSGRLVDVAMWIGPVRDAQGAVIGASAVLHDITARRQAERKCRQRAVRAAEARASRRLGQALHDHLSQHLLGAAFSAKALSHSLEPGSPAATHAAELTRLITTAVQQTRAFLHRPSAPR